MKLVTSLFFLFSLMTSFSQSGVEFLNQYLEECTKKEALYERTYTECEDGSFKAEIKYFNGTIRATGSYVLIEGEMICHGDFVFYYENGNKESEGSFKEGYKTGEWRRYMKDGTELRPKYYQPSLGNSIDAIIKG